MGACRGSGRPTRPPRAARPKAAQLATRRCPLPRHSLPSPLHVHPSLPQFPTKAADARGDHGRQLPTLEEEYRRVKLEQAIDAELERLAAKKAGAPQK